MADVTIGNILAWHMGVVEDGTPSFGLMRFHSDNSLSGKGNEVYCRLAADAGGPIAGMDNVSDVLGLGGTDVHWNGMSADGKKMSPAHISAKALFHLLHRDRKQYKGFEDLFDGPIYFEEQVHEYPSKELPFDCRSHLAWEPFVLSHTHKAYGTKKGMWYVWTETSSAGSDQPPTTPPGDPPPPPNSPTDVPPPPKDPVKPQPIPSGSGVHASPSPTIDSFLSSDATQGYLDTHLSHSFPEILAKGNPTHLGAPNLSDYRIFGQLRGKEKQDYFDEIHQRRSLIPVTAILTPIYPYFDNVWESPSYYNKPRDLGGNGPFLAGDAQGGWWLRPPQSHMYTLHDLSSGHPDWIDNSTPAHLGIAPLSNLYFGYPDVRTGGIYSDSTLGAWNIQMDKTNVLNFERFKGGSIQDTITMPTAGSGEIRLKRNVPIFFEAPYNDNYSDFATMDCSPGNTCQINFVVPYNFSSLVSIYLLFISSATDASVSTTISTQYSGNGEAHNTHTGSGSPALNVSSGRQDRLDISSYFSSAVAGDRCAFSIRNNDASTKLNLLGIEMVFNSTV